MTRKPLLIPRAAFLGKRPPYFTVYRAADGWRWRLCTANNRIVADSGESYTRRDRCIRAIGRTQAAASAARVVDGPVNKR